MVLIFLFLIILAIATAYICYRMVFFVPRAMTMDPFLCPEGPQYDALETEMHALIASAAAIPYTDVFTESFDGLKLHGKYYEVSPDAPVEILFHGYQSNAIRDFSGGLRFGENAADCSGCRTRTVLSD